MNDFLSPSALGLPSKFSSWRPHQADAIQSALDSTSAHILLICPTGFGKSPTYVAASRLAGGRCCILTSTKGLQSQLAQDFFSMGMVEMKGRNSYPCVETNSRLTCDEGPCIVGYQCPHRMSGCYYFDALRQAQRSDLVVTNYAYWLFSSAYAKDENSMGRFNLLVCDEAHDSPEHVASFLQLKISRTDDLLNIYLPSTSPHGMTMEMWQDWAKQTLPVVHTDIDDFRRNAKEDNSNLRNAARLIQFERTLKILAVFDPDNWVAEADLYEIRLAPVWSAKYCKEYLFGKISKTILTSASICGKTADMLGVAESERDLFEFPHTFPVENRMLIHLPTVRMNAKTSDLQLQQWLRRIDQILRGRLDRKGIIHTVSYKRRDFICSQSEYRSHMLTHGRKDVVKVVQQFKDSHSPRFLVSPSMTTGWDFPASECRFQIIGKIAYPDTRDAIIQARMSSDPEYAPYIAMQELIQACGRGIRSVDDWCENFIIDDNISWFIRSYSHLAPQWFLESFKKSLTIPMPPSIM